MKEGYKIFAIRLAKKAGKVIRKNFVAIGKKKEWKEDHTPITETDLAINKMVIDEVKESFPDHSILGEELQDMSGSGKFVWVCDPLDGTVPFSHGWQTSVFSLALVEDGKPIVGVIYDPYLDRMFFAEKGKGTTLNGEPVHVNNKSDFKRAVVTVVPIDHDQTYNVLPVVEIFTKKGAMLVNVGAICYMGMLLAAGEFTASIFAGTTAHDSAAIKILVEEAGGKVTDLYGKEQRYDQKTRGHIASNGLVHDELLEMVSPFLPKSENG